MEFLTLNTGAKMPLEGEYSAVAEPPNLLE